MAREVTTQLINALDEGMLSAQTVLMVCLGWMSEDEVKEMVETHDLLFTVDEE